MTSSGGDGWKLSDTLAMTYIHFTKKKNLAFIFARFIYTPMFAHLMEHWHFLGYRNFPIEK